MSNFFCSKTYTRYATDAPKSGKTYFSKKYHTHYVIFLKYFKLGSRYVIYPNMHKSPPINHAAAGVVSSITVTVSVFA